ncbi:LOW QUALITY PROTEIN: hypothetical protein CVT26_009066 [Gymnopilus dilepis]|uniref:Uncharacterized protein n=1 Tax=Gymnopilus dilepis TaxID=231916 RepID=A0A409YR81_9AGAR|nr:LOW QUALITY PROTEIN: hypothetical protein CVT26_009066 [Gymnopilus dilepis]
MEQDSVASWTVALRGQRSRVSGAISSNAATGIYQEPPGSHTLICLTAETNGLLQRCKIGNVTRLSALFWAGLLISPSRQGERLRFILLRDSMIYTVAIAIVYGSNIRSWLLYLVRNLTWPTDEDILI